MKQEEVDKIMNKINKRCKLPKYWDDFIEKNSKNHHIIIKDSKNKTLYCTNCSNYFVDKSVKVRDYIKCPHCEESSVVYGINYYRKCFEQSVVLVQRIDKQVVIRVFEIFSYFDNDSYKINRSFVEYIRILPGIGRFIGSNVYINMFGGFSVSHNNRKINWSEYKGQRFFTDYPTYPYNKKRLLKGTIMEYAPINDFLQKYSYYRYNFLDVLELAAYSSFELLWNMKLYNLSFYSKALNKNGSFYKRFGVPKNYLKFMQDINISYKELMLLKLFNKPDKEIIQKYRYYNINHLRYLVKNDILDMFLNSSNKIDKNTIDNLKEISKFIPLKKLRTYSKGFNNLNIYKDYLNMSKELALNYKSKKDLFPRNLMARHDKMQKKIKINEDMNTQFSAYIRYLELSKYTYSDDKYIIFPAPSIDSIKDEGRQQGNCVASLYLDPYIKGTTEIFFARDLNDVNKSLITLEYKNGQIRQKELLHHSRKFTAEHEEFFNDWIIYRNFIDGKAKKQTKVTNIIEYKLEKLVA